MWSEDITWPEFVQGQKQAMVFDLWMATGREAVDFDTFVAEHGWPLVWSLLLAEQRPVRPPCMEPTGPDDFCVFSDGHTGPHYGADDVAAPVDLPPGPIQLAPPLWTLREKQDGDDA